MGLKYKALSIDPGKHNGVSLWEYDKDGNYEMYNASAIDKQALYNLIEYGDMDLIIYEGYRLYADKAQTMIGNEFETPQIIGVIKYLADKRSIPTVMQMATCKRFFDDKRIKKMGFNPPTMHAKDSIRHWLYWFYFSAEYGTKSDLL
jgi:hypothetical protein